jgi:hypothetical protein
MRGGEGDGDKTEKSDGDKAEESDGDKAEESDGDKAEESDDAEEESDDDEDDDDEQHAIHGLAGDAYYLLVPPEAVERYPHNNKIDLHGIAEHFEVKCDAAEHVTQIFDLPAVANQVQEAVEVAIEEQLRRSGGEGTCEVVFDTQPAVMPRFFFCRVIHSHSQCFYAPPKSCKHHRCDFAMLSGSDSQRENRRLSKINYDFARRIAYYLGVFVCRMLNLRTPEVDFSAVVDVADDSPGKKGCSGIRFRAQWGDFDQL